MFCRGTMSIFRTCSPLYCPWHRHTAALRVFSFPPHSFLRLPRYALLYTDYSTSMRHGLCIAGCGLKPLSSGLAIGRSFSATHLKYIQTLQAAVEVRWDEERKNMRVAAGVFLFFFWTKQEKGPRAERGPAAARPCYPLFCVHTITRTHTSYTCGWMR